MNPRPSKIEVGNVVVPIPAYYPSISTIKTALMPSEYIDVLYSLRSLKPRFLVSAYDLESHDNRGLQGLLHKSISAGATILMDSGNYESYWKDKRSQWTQQKFHNILRQYPWNVAFGFDEQDPPDDEDIHFKLIIDRWQRDKKVAGDRAVIPIVHGSFKYLPDLILRVVLETQVPMIAVAERRLGDGVLERAQAVKVLRDVLDSSGRYVGLHLLGTGNPISIALYSAAGADSFDGLEWCQTVVDHESACLFHFSHADFFQDQTKWGNLDISFQARTLAHNLEFYSLWMHKIRHAIHNNNMKNFCYYNLPKKIYNQCKFLFE